MWVKKESERETASPTLMIYHPPGLHRPGTVFLENGIQKANKLFRIDELLGAEGVHLFIEVGNLHPGLNEEAELLRQVGQQFFHVRNSTTQHSPASHHLLQLVLEGRVDGADGILPAEE